MRRNINFLSWLMALMLCLFLTSGKEPTDDMLKDLCRRAAYAMQGVSDTDTAAQWKALKPQVDALESKCDISKISPRQVDMLFEAGGITLDGPLRSWISPILKAKAGKDNMQFIFLYWRYYPGANGFSFTDGEIEAYKNVVSNPGLKKFAKENPKAMNDLIDGAAAIPANDWKRIGFVADVKALLACPLSEDACTRTVGVFNNAFSSDSLTAQDKEAIRQSVLACYEKVVKETDFASRRKRAAAQVAYLNSLFATNKLIGHIAPRLDFAWISNGSEKTLADFHGKVVMLDFWATKCAPCIESFPKIAALQTHYQGKDVVILGITSAQGYFIDKPNQRTVSTANNPQKEYSLTPSYMKSMGMNWTVAYTRQNVMNTDYGVLAIPHVTIIDKQGRVRYNDVNGDNEEIIRLIDGLLAE